jgi:hypothetical protein
MNLKENLALHGISNTPPEQAPSKIIDIVCKNNQ